MSHYLEIDRSQLQCATYQFVAQRYLLLDLLGLRVALSFEDREVLIEFSNFFAKPIAIEGARTAFALSGVVGGGDF